MKTKFNTIMTVTMFGILASFALTEMAFAHCDTLDGPVVKTAKAALEKGDVTPVLKWVKKEDEAEIRKMFNKTIAVRAKGPEAKELADMYFFETLVRIHRAGEGAPYTGLKPGGNLDFAIVQADKALETGNVDGLVKTINNLAGEGLRHRFKNALEKKKNADKSIEDGREFVEAYVGFLHYTEGLYNDIKPHAEGHGHGKEEAPESTEHHHKHNHE